MMGQSRKAKKMPVERNRIMTAFSIWLKQNERYNQQKQSGADAVEIAKAASIEWRGMADAEKAIWRKQQSFRVDEHWCLYCDIEKSSEVTEKLWRVSIKVTVLPAALSLPTKKFRLYRTHNAVRDSYQLQSINFFTFLPDKIIIDHIFRLLLPTHYSTLHLVSRRFRHLLISYAHHLPKLKLDELTFEVDHNTEALIASTYNARSIKKPVPCRNLEIWADISRQDELTPEFMEMTRHIEFSGLLKFDDEFFTLVVLQQLTMMALIKRLKPDAVEFGGCMEQITEGQLELFLQSVAPTMTSLTVNRSSDSLHVGLFTDALLKPIVSSGQLNVFRLLSPVAVTDETLDSYRFPERFVLDFAHQKVTSQGVLRFIRRFKACETNMKPNEQQLLYLNVNLEKALRRLIRPDKRQTKSESGVSWIIKKNPKSSSSPILVIDFDEVFFDLF